MKDKSGREYLKLADAKQGMIIEIDNGFTCRAAGRVMLYHDCEREGSSGVYFMCKDGSHFISGQSDNSIHCVGMYP